MLDAAREGRAASVVIRGGAGMGKSALLDDTAARARGTVLRTAGLQSESALAFASLHRLLRPVQNRVPALPDLQEAALRVAFGVQAGDRPDPFIVGLATLSLLTEVADAGPVVCLVDDLQWLDAASVDALLFATRRLLAEPVTMIFAARDDDPGYSAPADVAELVLGGLSAGAVRSLLRERSGFEPSDEVVAELIARTSGNPLAVVELPARLSAAQLAGTALLPAQLPLTARVERVFLDRCRRLSVPAQTLLLVAAADDAVPPSVLVAAGRELDVPEETLHEVEAAGLLLVSDADTVSVRHPLVRSAVYQAATGFERRTAHRALAAALRGPGDDDRRTWHRAAAADGPDDDVAQALAAVGARAEGRGGHDAASSAYERAARLSTSDDQRAAWLFTAARHAYAAGMTLRAGVLVADARPLADQPVLRAGIDRLRGRIDVAGGSAVDAHRIFITSARVIAADAPERALEMAAYAGVLRGHGVDSGTRLPPGTLSTAVAADDAARVRCLKLLLDATDRDAAGDWEATAAALRTALQQGLDADDRDVWANLANMALHLGDDAAHRALFTAMLSAARTDGAVMDVLYALNRLWLSQFTAGEWSLAGRAADEAVSLARSVGQPAQTAAPLGCSTLLAALQGRSDYDDLLAETTTVAADHRLGVMDGPVTDLLRWAEGAHAAHSGDPAEAAHQFGRMQVPVVMRLAAASRIAAAVAASQRRRAAEWTAHLEGFAAATGSAWANAVAQHGCALLADPVDAPALFDLSLRHHDAARRPYDAACAQLAYGEHLRRAGRRVDARVHLRTALDTFTDLDAAPLVDRATRELRASGETARRRDPSTIVQLTPTEQRIAELVSQGLSNKEVAAQCWISPRTVAFHLRNVFTKTGVTSRGELAHLDLT